MFLEEIVVAPITGVMVGIEYINEKEEGRFICLDLFILRILFVLSYPKAIS